eukprot:gene4626-9186_t
MNILVKVIISDRLYDDAVLYTDAMSQKLHSTIHGKYHHSSSQVPPHIEPWISNGTVFAGIPDLDIGCWLKIIDMKHGAILNKYDMCLRSYPDIVSDFILKNGIWDDCVYTLQLWNERANSPGSIFLDVGANIGSCSLLLAANGIPVVAFEPLPSNLFYFSRSIQRNINSPYNKVSSLITLYPYAAGKKYSELSMHVEKGNYGNAVLGKAVTDFQNAIMEETNFNITIVPLDDVLWPNRSRSPPLISIMKIDIQGYELEAFKGAKHLLAAGAIPVIQLEMAPLWLHAQGTTAGRLCEILLHYNYSLYRSVDRTKGFSLEHCKSFDNPGQNLRGKSFEIFAFLLKQYKKKKRLSNQCKGVIWNKKLQSALLGTLRSGTSGAVDY